MKGTLLRTMLVTLLVLGASSAQAEVSGSIFEMENGYIHPFISMKTKFTDNVYSLTGKAAQGTSKEDFVTTVSPGLALALPGSRSVNINLSADTGAPGGIAMSRNVAEATNRYQAFLVYSPKFDLYTKNSKENLTNHSVKGALQFNFPMGLQIDVANQYDKTSEMLGENGVKGAKRNKYNANLFDSVANYEVGPRLKVGLHFSMYDLDYDFGASSFRNRMDTTYGVTASWKAFPKTRIFTELETIDLDYDETKTVTVGQSQKTVNQDATQNDFRIGVDWNMTSKAKGTLKTGYSGRDFKQADRKDVGDLYLEGMLAYRFTQRDMLTLVATRKTNESTYDDMQYKTNTRFNAQYAHTFPNQRLSAKAALSWTMEDYESEDASILEIENRIFNFSPSVDYAFKKWLKGSVGFSLNNRTSNHDGQAGEKDLEYLERSVYVSLSATI